MNRIFSLFALLLLGSGGFAQEASVIEQPTEAFPFKITLVRPDSSEVASSAVLTNENQFTLLAFWLTTCIPCSIELDAYSQHYATWKKEHGLEIIAISMDFADKFRRIEARLAEKKYPFPVYWDRIRALKYILPGGLNGYPQIFLFDQKGQLVWRKKGYLSGDETKMLDEVIKRKTVKP